MAYSNPTHTKGVIRQTVGIKRNVMKITHPRTTHAGVKRNIVVNTYVEVQ